VRRVAVWAGSIAVAATVTLLAVLVLEAQLLRPLDDEISDPDAIVVLGGLGSERVDVAIDLHERYDAPLVLSSSARAMGAEAGVGCPPAVCILTDPETTAGEARGVAELADERGWDRIAVVTAQFHTARARMLFRQCFGDRVAVVGAAREDGRGPGIPTRTNEMLGLLAGSTLARAC
jgi:uncharacterized SAM-binding protein YcdF (DUF218 family)